MQYIRFICFLLIAALAEAGLPTALAPAIASEQTVAREMNINDLNASAKVRVKAPAAWTSSETSVVLRDEYQEAIAGVQFTVICNDKCGDEQIANLPKVIDQTFETRARPNLNTGDPALDAVRLKVDLVEEGNVPDGKFRIARVTKPAGLQGPYREHLYAVCIRAKKGTKIVAAQAWAPVAREELGLVIVNACRTFEIL